ncbi:nitrate reductase molybdenum cofactor assembly chaperone [Fodinisporobacter ferrooxydans]|uniref:Nitrate reductase molybdenum cofactor assembly chaperone n=1 Tax=Fodinisporobacter ferrooxydans TaxID=2901836 RepID=A0ABY4CQM0_9BACL|nr:nitrate reductase molybdenum cofactor assembly chaperone [Alicyclobacillaceae bacterium MYW30-H2]
MKHSRQKYFKVFSYMLGYPNASFFDGIAELEEWLKGLPPKEARGLLQKGCERFTKWNIMELQKHYVATFDFKDSTSLHLTAHEHGDGRDRGAALVRLKAMLGSAGYEELDGELPDYIPLLFEFLAEETDPVMIAEIEQRLAKGIAKIRKAMDPASPYTLIFAAAEQILPVVQKSGETPYDHENQKPDLEELPYPLYYEH